MICRATARRSRKSATANTGSAREPTSASTRTPTRTSGGERYTWSDLNGSGVWEPGEEGRREAAAVASRSNRWTPDSSFQFSERSPRGSSASCLRMLACGRASCGEASDSTSCARTRTGHSTRSPCRFPFQIPARTGESTPQTMGPRFRATTSARARGSGAHQHRAQCARRRQPLLDVGHHRNQALVRQVVAGGRIRAHLEPRPGERILRSARPPEHLSADAERPYQCR